MKLLLSISLISFTFLFVYWFGKVSWDHSVGEKVKTISANAVATGETVNIAETNLLPYPVKRYFHLVLKPNSPIISQVHIVQKGGFRAKPEQKVWSRMEAQQEFSTSPRAFIWDARISIISGISVRVRDSYINGIGEMKGKLLSLIPVIDMKDRDELNTSALQRYLAEAVWFPTALLPSQGVRWDSLDRNRALATITESGVTVSLEFEFNEKGEITSVYSPARYREVVGEFIPTPWKGYFATYREIKGYQIPTAAEVGWLLNEQRYSYWKARLVDVSYK